MDPCPNSPHKSKAPVGRYANHFAVNFSRCEFIFDFGQSYSQNGHAELFNKIITRPAYARELLEILRDSIARYANRYENDS
jgi:hypothetical protein